MRFARKKTFGDSFQRIAVVFRGEKERSRVREKRREIHRRKATDVDGRVYVVFRACCVEEERRRRKSRCACHGQKRVAEYDSGGRHGNVRSVGQRAEMEYEFVSPVGGCAVDRFFKN